jgi:hypothetical protein
MAKRSHSKPRDELPSEIEAWQATHEIIPELELTPAVVRPVLVKFDNLLAVLERYQTAGWANEFHLDELLLDLWQQAFSAAVAVEQEMDRIGFGPRKRIALLRGRSGALCTLDRWLRAMRMGTQWRPAAKDKRQETVTEDEVCRDTWGTTVQSGHWRADLTNMPDMSKMLAKLRAWVEELWHTYGPPAPKSHAEHLALIAGGYVYRGEKHDLVGQPRKMLTALMVSYYGSCGIDELREALSLNDISVTYPEQAVADTAKKLRASLRQAVGDAGLTCADPLPSVGQGKDLTYALKMP